MPPRPQRVGCRTEDVEELRLLSDLPDGGGEELSTPGVRLVFTDVAGACPGVSDSVPGAGEVPGDDEVDIARRMPTEPQGLAPLG